MKFETNTIQVFNGNLILPLPKIQTDVFDKLTDATSKGKTLQVSIDVKRKNRSLNANSYLWLVIGEMASVLHTDKDSVYLQMLERYGVFTHVVVKPNVVDRIKHDWRTVRELGEITINGQKGVQLQCYFGSHTYNTKEFSVLLDGVITEAKELGIDVISEADKDLMLKEWGQ